MSAIARLRELFLLSRAAEEARLRPAARREAIGGALRLGRQRSDAAEALWSNGHAAEGLRLAVDALERTLSAAERLIGEVVVAPELEASDAVEDREANQPTEGKSPDETRPAEAAQSEPAEEASEAAESPQAEPARAHPTEGQAEAEAETEEALAQPARDASTDIAANASSTPPIASPWAAVLRARGLPKERVDGIEHVLRLARQPLPEIDDAVSATHAELYKELFRARADADKVLAPASYSPSQIRWRAAQRIATTALVVVLALVLAFFALRTPRTVTANASAHFRNDPQFGADRVFDDDPNTEWLLNDGQTGWLEARLSPPRDMRQLRILNGHNRHFNDRGVKEYTLELFDGTGAKVFETEGELEFSPTPEWVSHDLSAGKIERIRFTVKSFHRQGGALAEIAWDER